MQGTVDTGDRGGRDGTRRSLFVPIITIAKIISMIVIIIITIDKIISMIVIIILT